MSTESSRRKGEENRTRVREFFKQNPNATHRSCSAALKLSVFAIHRHMQVIREEDRSNE